MDQSKICPKYEASVEVLGKKWTGLIIHVLLEGAKRFKDIKQQIPDMSDRMVSERMKELEEVGIVERKVFSETPVRIEYHLTEKGKDLESVIASIQSWGEKWM